MNTAPAGASRLLRFFGLLLFGLAACQSAASSISPAGGPTQVSFLDLKSGQQFVLVNDAHTDRLSHYSDRAADPNTKVVEDSTMELLVKHLFSAGFADYGREGTMPRQANGVLSKVMEIQGAGGSTWFGAGRGSSAEELNAITRCYASFLDLYNATTGYQARDLSTLNAKQP